MDDIRARKRVILSLSVILLPLIVLIGFNVINSDTLGGGSKYLSKEYIQTESTSYVIITKNNKKIFLSEKNPFVIETKKTTDKFLKLYLEQNPSKDMNTLKEILTELCINRLNESNYFKNVNEEIRSNRINQKINNIKGIAFTKDEGCDIMTVYISAEVELISENGKIKNQRRLFNAAVNVMNNKIHDVFNEKYTVIRK